MYRKAPSQPVWCRHYERMKAFVSEHGVMMDDASLSGAMAVCDGIVIRLSAAEVKALRALSTAGEIYIDPNDFACMPVTAPRTTDIRLTQ